MGEGREGWGRGAPTPLRRGSAPLHPRERGALYPVLVLRTRLRRGARGGRGCPRRLVSLWRVGGEEVGTGGLREVRWGCGSAGSRGPCLRGAKAAEPLWVLTVHGRMEGGLESRLQSSPAEGLAVTEAEAGRRGEARGRWKKGRERLRVGCREGVRGRPPSFGVSCG